MLIEYIGHSCFKITDEKTGYAIVFDPYKPGSVPGYSEICEKADLVLCSHKHDDHYGKRSVELKPMTKCPFSIEKIHCYHDPEKGSLRGENSIHIVTLERTGETVIHYGDLGEDLDEFLDFKTERRLSGADLALIPVGGYYTIDKDQAVDLIKRTAPKMAIPMHFRSEKYGFGYPEIGTIEDFVRAAVSGGLDLIASNGPGFDTKDIKDAPKGKAGQICVMIPKNIEK